MERARALSVQEVTAMPRKKKEAKQKRLDTLCPFMSRRITHRDWEGNPVEELVRQACVGDDCELWDLDQLCCSMNIRSSANTLYKLAEVVTIADMRRRRRMLRSKEKK